MKPAAMACDHQLLVVTRVRTPAATAAAMAAVSVMACLRRGAIAGVRRLAMEALAWPADGLGGTRPGDPAEWCISACPSDH